MSDLENKLRNLALRDLPADLRRQVLAAAEAAQPREPRWTLRDWFWPSPAAWAALAMVLVGAATFDASYSAAGPAPAQFADRKEAQKPVLLAFRARGELFSELLP